jgi:hypothetical protein
MLNLQAIRAEFLRANAPYLPKKPYVSSGKSNIYLSELGDCPRKVMLRLTDAEKKHREGYELDNLQVMYALGDFLHELTASSLEWFGALISYERTVQTWEGFGGRLDVEFQDGKDIVLMDIKSRRSQAFKYDDDLPKHEHVLQVGAYLLEEGCIATKACVDYVDRGGSNSDVVKVLDMEFARIAAAEAMRSLSEIRAQLPELPPPLPAELKEHYNRSKPRALTSVGRVRSWRCNYCDFESASCKPDAPAEEIILAEADKKNLLSWKVLRPEESLFIVAELGKRVKGLEVHA